MQRTPQELSFDSLLGVVSSQLLRTSTWRIDAAIRRSVEAIGRHYGVDRVDIRRFNADRSETNLLSGWTSSDDVGVSSDLRNDEALWASSMILRGQVVRVCRLDDMPEGSTSASRMLMKEDGLEAALLIPINLDGKLFGAVVLACKTEREWTGENATEVKALGELIAIAHTRARMLGKLWTSEARLRAIVEEQTEFVVRYLPDGTITWVNDAYCEYVAQKRETLVGTSFLELIAPDSQEKLFESIRQISPDKPTRTDEVRLTTTLGRSCWQRWTCKGIFSLSGDLIELQSLGRDVTNRKAAENALRQSESRHRDLVENISDWIWEVDLDFNIVYSNARVEDMLGYTAEEIRHHAAHELLHPDSLHEVQVVLKKQDASPIGWEHLLLRFRHKNGGYRVMQSNARPKFDAEGHLVGFRGVDRDVTEVVRTQDEILRRSAFQHRLADLSTNLLTAPLEDTIRLVNEEFRHLCERYDFYSANLWTVGDKRNTAKRRAGWRNTSKITKAPSDIYSRDEMPWFVSQLLSDNILRLDTLEDMPDEAAAERATFKAVGVKSLLGFSAVTGGGLRGYSIFATDTPRQWDDATVQELNLIANTLTAACARVWAAEEMLQGQRDLMRSQAVASLGSYSINFDPPATEFQPDISIEQSPQHLKLFGADTEHATTGELFRRIHPDDREQAVAVMKKQFGTKQAKPITFRVIRPDHSIVHVENRVEFDKDDEGRITRAFGTDYDVTEQVTARQKLEEALAEIQQLSAHLKLENTFLRDEIRVAHGFDRIIGSGPKLKHALMLAEKVAPTGVSVLVLGETGTGKELIAQAIHDLSDRKDKVMISVNCAALSRDLIESELFGHEKGAFTGAHERRKGRFELADGGTLFLDEIGELPADLQAKLLRVLQSGDFVRLGGTETLNVDVRIVAATNRDLRRAVDEGEFRADLFYRIGTFPIELPPLRERREDIPALIEFLVQKHAERMGKNIHSISVRTIRHLSQQPWPGNVRELESVLQRALISTPGPTLDYVEEIESVPVHGTATAVPHSATDLLEVQRQHILTMLNATNWVIDGKNGAAAKMGIAASTLRSKMKRLDIQRPN